MPRLRVTIHLVKKCTCSGTGGGTEGANGTVGVRTTLSERGRGLRGAAPSPKNTLAVSGTPDRPPGAGSPPASPLSPTRWRRGTEEGPGGSGGRKRRLPRSARLGRKGGRETAPEVAPLGSPQLPSVPLGSPRPVEPRAVRVGAGIRSAQAAVQASRLAGPRPDG